MSFPPPRKENPDPTELESDAMVVLVLEDDIKLNPEDSTGGEFVDSAEEERKLNPEALGELFDSLAPEINPKPEETCEDSSFSLLSDGVEDIKLNPEDIAVEEESFDSEINPNPLVCGSSFISIPPNNDPN